MSESQVPSASTSSSNLQPMLNTGHCPESVREKKTRSTYSLTPCSTASSLELSRGSEILVVLQDKVTELDQSRRVDERLSRWLNPIINVSLRILHHAWSRYWTCEFRSADSYARLQYLNINSQVFSPAQAIFAGVGVLFSFFFFKMFIPGGVLLSARLSVSILLDPREHIPTPKSFSGGQGVEASQGALVDHIENFFKRLQSYTAMRPIDVWWT